MTTPRPLAPPTEEALLEPNGPLPRRSVRRDQEQTIAELEREVERLRAAVRASRAASVKRRRPAAS